MRATVTVRLKPGVLDPQGEAIHQALEGLGNKNVQKVRVSKLIELEVDDADPAVAKAALESMADALLANPVIETYVVEVKA